MGGEGRGAEYPRTAQINLCPNKNFGKTCYIWNDKTKSWLKEMFLYGVVWDGTARYLGCSQTPLVLTGSIADGAPPWPERISRLCCCLRAPGKARDMSRLWGGWAINTNAFGRWVHWGGVTPPIPKKKHSKMIRHDNHALLNILDQSLFILIKNIGCEIFRKYHP